VTLTFDDGPDPAGTPELLDVLKSLGIKACFFPVGKKTREHPEIVNRIDEEGHVLGNHSFSHAWWTNFLISGALDREIQRSQDALAGAVGKVPAYFRPPMGLTNPHLSGNLKKRRLTVIGWDIRPFDTRRPDDRVLEKVLKKIRNGSIILLHDDRKGAGEWAPFMRALATGIKARGFSIVGLEELVGVKPYQKTEEPTLNESDLPFGGELGGRQFRNRRGFRGYLAGKLAASPYIRKVMQDRVSLEAFKTRPSRRFLLGVSLVLASYILGWPMVGLFSFLAAYSRTPALLFVGSAFYGFSHLVFILGMYFAGRDCIRYADLMLRWGLRRTIQRTFL
jgi:peptidoglycan/xylan/chitin deacetylase (PgdA/CDA1 family)